jgi:hypothetical protein
MTKVLASITTSVDGYIAGPDDGPGKGLGEGGERLHYWVFGKPRTYETGTGGEPTGEDAAWLEQAVSRVGAVVGGRWTYEAARGWGGENPCRLRRRPATRTSRARPGQAAFDGFTTPLELEHLGVRQSPFATFIDYRVKRS